MIPISVISLLTPRELETMVCGEPTVDLELLKSVTDYQGGLTRESEMARWFWEVLEEMNQVRQRREGKRGGKTKGRDTTFLDY